MQDKVAVVTGGSRGMGLEISHDFARRGFRVVVSSRKQAACEIVARELRERYSTEARALSCHVGHWQECDGLIERTLDEFGRIDVLVNNAGMSPVYPSLADVSEELFDKVIGVNLKGPFRLAVLAGVAMERGDGGQIVNIGSVAALQPHANELPYAAAKAGLNTLTVGLAHAFGPRVRINGILPGMFRTDISKAWTDEIVAKSQTAALRRIASPDEIVGTVRYLTSAESSYTTGAIVKVDGGLTWSPA
jgi:NAD(P)-dependent dehydrogenase (short-subunit alcohol dehydrogenase family)